ncbi:hypothetical protein SAMN05660649_00561 [Desulfotomaculum arcticum]|uniref:Uncharacterized protein n=1 Tax=Desulfotruncus arcticus DSM 17038 TaxID=1121424 RepID=A0A1I2P0R8_9FIRM|nr:hypothetical protein SAMN05660649_00561 [Desulfotomaculum arcticum] [Desulfotruncus arcticus DSM 17038]
MLIKVDIRHGQVLKNNLRVFWDSLADSRGCGDTGHPVCTPTACPASGAAVGAQLSPCSLPAQADNAQAGELRQRISAFNARPGRKTKHAWSEAELFRLALLVGRQKQNYEQVAARLARTPRACQFMFRELQKAGVV